MSSRLSRIWKRTIRLFRKEIWDTSHLADHSPRGVFYALLRVLSITWNVFFETNAASRAAALTFSSLLGLAPLLVIAFSVAGFVIGTDNPAAVQKVIGSIIGWAAPQVTQVTEGGSVDVNPQLLTFLNDIIEKAQSAPAGVVGALTLIVIAVQLFTSIENTCNEIWGVRQGRSWLLRIVFYWTLLTLGSILFFAAVALIGAGTASQVFEVPWFGDLTWLFNLLLPAISLATLLFLLTFFYRFIPNTHVRWDAAFAGAVVVTAVLVLNNILSFVYLNRVLLTQSLYGGLSAPIILMFGLYFFWLFILVGCQISYAIQNADYRSSRAAWGTLAMATRERLTLVVLLTICRRFAACLPPVTASSLSSLIKIPAHVLNESLNRLVDLKMITPVPPETEEDEGESAYHPSKPLNRMTLSEFREIFEARGEDPLGDSIERIDPLIRLYRERSKASGPGDLLAKPLDQLFDEVPFDDSHPPFRKLGAH